MWITHGPRKIPFKNGTRWCRLVPPSENSFCVITQECLDRFTSNLMCGLLMDRGRFLSKMGTRWCCLVPPSENSFTAITQECLDQFTSNLMCGLLMDRGRFLSPIGTRWCCLVPSSENGVRATTQECLDQFTSNLCVDYSWTKEGSFQKWAPGGAAWCHHLKTVSVR